MINLLPPETKENFFYARRNAQLLRWVCGIGIGLAGIVIVSLVGMVFLQRTTTDYERNNSSAATLLKTQNVSEAQATVEDISNNLKLVVKVLAREVLFSKLLTQIATVLPRGSVLTSLNIGQTTGGIDIEAAATDYSTGSQVQANLADPNNKIFSKADLILIQCQATTGGVAFSANYPCKVQVRAQFAANNPFLFINSGATP
ncbi:MAG TPA: hypothetical protein VLI54_00495 [Bacillota bacterium]|nr:hypothetical protein [Bacillota bacterium]